MAGLSRTWIVFATMVVAAALLFVRGESNVAYAQSAPTSCSTSTSTSTSTSSSTSYYSTNYNAAYSEVELEFWRSIKDSNKVEEYNAYLTNYPSGAFKAVALSRIASLQDGPSNATA